MHFANAIIVEDSIFKETSWLAKAAYIGGFACVLNFDDVSPAIELAAVEVGEAVDSRQLTTGQRLSVSIKRDS